MDEERKLVFCEIPGCGSVGLRWLLGITGSGLTSGLKNTDTFQNVSIEGDLFLATHGLKRLSQFSVQQQNYILGPQYFKFMFVKKPFQRLISVYETNFENKDNSNYIWKIYGNIICNLYRTGIDKAKCHPGDINISFTEFITFLTDLAPRQRPYEDANWMTYFDLCNPCTIKYNFVGKFESLTEDLTSIAPQLNLHLDGLHSLMTDTKLEKILKLDLLEKYHRLLAPEVRKRLRSIYERDYVLYHYL